MMRRPSTLDTTTVLSFTCCSDSKFLESTIPSLTTKIDQVNQLFRNEIVNVADILSRDSAQIRRLGLTADESNSGQRERPCSSLCSSFRTDILARSPGARLGSFAKSSSSTGPPKSNLGSSTGLLINKTIKEISAYSSPSTWKTKAASGAASLSCTLKHCDDEISN